MADSSLPIDGVRRVPLEVHRDDRGSLTEIFRGDWGLPVDPIQWNVVANKADVLRGVHVHHRHSDFLVLVDGDATIGMTDLRPSSPTHRASVTLAVDGDDLVGLVIPPGVAHGFFFHGDGMHVYSVSRYWDPDDELGCRWDDPGLGIDWPEQDVILSSRDAELPSLAVLQEQLATTGLF